MCFHGSLDRRVGARSVLRGAITQGGQIVMWALGRRGGGSWSPVGRRGPVMAPPLAVPFGERHQLPNTPLRPVRLMELVVHSKQ